MNYDFGNKRQYRRDVGAFADRNLDLIPRKQRTVLYLDTSKAAETEFWLSRGYSKANLHAFNFNPAVAAIISRKYPGVQAHGIPIIRAAQIVKDLQIRPSIVHLDYCGSMNIRRFDEINKIVNEAAITGTVICLNTLRGREKGIQKYKRLWVRATKHQLDLKIEVENCNLTSFVRFPEMDEPDDIRRQLHLFSLTVRSDLPGQVWGTFDLVSKKYRSAAGNQTMSWTAISIMKEWPPLAIYSTKIRQLKQFIEAKFLNVQSITSHQSDGMLKEALKIIES